MKPCLYLLIPALFLVSCGEQEVITQQIEPDNYDDCITESMQGVSSDIAARAIIEACQNQFLSESQEEQETNQSTEGLFLEIELNKETAYVRDYLFFTIKLNYTINGIRNPQFTELEMPDTVIQLIGIPNQYAKLIDGVPHGVYEKRYLVSPQKSGSLEIPNILFRGEVTDDSGTIERVTASIEGISIQVDERPSSGYQAEVRRDRIGSRNGTVTEVNSDTPFTGVLESCSPPWFNRFRTNPNRPCNRSTFKDGQQDGLWVRFHENGQLADIANYKDGELDGLQETYYINGQLNLRANYKDGNLDGLRVTYYGDGKLQERTNYKDGELLGRCYEPGCTDFN